MVTNHNQQKLDDMDILDDEWWTSLLAQEERFAAFSMAHNVTATAAQAVIGGSKEQNTSMHSTPHQTPVDWQTVQGLFDHDQTIQLTVNGYNRGGLLVEGPKMHGFVPISHLVDVMCDLPEEQRDQAFEIYVGRNLFVKVIECDEQRGRVVFSERAAQASEGRRIQLLQELRQGECVPGIITNITDFGVFVDLGGVEGLVHVSEISWGRVRHPTDIVHVGQEISAYVIHVDRERARIALSLKRLCNNPWETVDLRYHSGQIIDAVVTSVVTYGAFARVEEGLDGLIHITEMGSNMAESPQVYLTEGQKIQVRILHIDAERQRLGLSLNVNQD